VTALIVKANIEKISIIFSYLHVDGFSVTHYLSTKDCFVYSEHSGVVLKNAYNVKKIKIKNLL